MNAARTMLVEAGGTEDAGATFARDQVMLLRVADDGAARARVWRRPEPGLVLGRFHCAEPAVGGSGLSRRLSGGRIVPVGPGVVGVTMAAPSVNWFDPASAALRPEQVLNRAVRALLALLRGDGVDAFYPGRDLVTVGGRPLAHLSFTVMRDGAAVVEMHVAETVSFAGLPGLLDRFDPAGAAGVDRDALAGAVCLADVATPARGDDEWASRVASFAASTFRCEARVAPDDAADVTPADARAAADFLGSPGPAPEGVHAAAAVSMLGVVECTGRRKGDRLTGLRLTGDLIAPFHTVDDIASECEGEPLRPANIRKALARAMARPRSFLLGLRDLDELILRLAA
jgi:hypothetical protein